MRDSYDFKDGTRNPYVIQFVKVDDGYLVKAPSGKTVGELIIAEDGEWVFWPEECQSAWSHYMLSKIADKLAELNREQH